MTKFPSRFLTLYACAILVVALAAFATMGRANADSSDALRQTLGALRGLGPASFSSVVSWARNAAPQVPVPLQDYERAEAQILNLTSDDRQAVLWWLQGNGRSALYSRGATDDQIGPLRSGVDPGAAPATPAPNSWRDLSLASATLGDAVPPSKIEVLNGFAAAMRDGTNAMACVSFKNVAPLAAMEVVFDFPLLDANGNTVGSLRLGRRGMFSPDIGIMSYASLQDFISSAGAGNSRYIDNCAKISRGIAAVPILTARYATYRITRVEYVDGSEWRTPASNGAAI